MLQVNIWVFVYGIINLIGALVFLVATSDGLELEELFNPNRIYRSHKVNWFGAYLLAISSFLCMTPFALMFYIYKLCTIGRK